MFGFIIQDWMCKLGLSGDQLLVYAFVFYEKSITREKINSTLNIDLNKTVDFLLQKQFLKEDHGNIVVQRTSKIPKQQKENYLVQRTRLLTELSSDDKNKTIKQKVNAVYERFLDENIRNLLLEYLNIRIKRGLNDKQWESMLDKLSNESETKQDCIEAIQNAIQGQYMTFYPKKSSTNFDNTKRVEKHADELQINTELKLRGS